MGAESAGGKSFEGGTLSIKCVREKILEGMLQYAVKGIPSTSVCIG
jgi:hypothetical protein